MRVEVAPDQGDASEFASPCDGRAPDLVVDIAPRAIGSLANDETCVRGVWKRRGDRPHKTVPRVGRRVRIAAIGIDGGRNHRLGKHRRVISRVRDGAPDHSAVGGERPRLLASNGNDCWRRTRLLQVEDLRSVPLRHADRFETHGDRRQRSKPDTLDEIDLQPIIGRVGVEQRRAHDTTAARVPYVSPRARLTTSDV